MTETEYLKLKKPAGNEYYGIEDFNSNADLVDAELKRQADADTALETSTANLEKAVTDNDARDDGQDTQIAELGTTLGQHGTAITALQKDAHTHTNKSVLDGITAEKVEAWDNPTTAEFHTVSLPASKWTGNGPYTQAVSVAGILADDRPIFGPVYAGTNDEKIEQSIMAGFVSSCETAAGSVTFTALLAKPEVDLTMQLEVIR